MGFFVCSALREVNDESETFQVNTVKGIIHFIKKCLFTYGFVSDEFDLDL